MKVLKTIIATAVIVFALTTVAMAGAQHFTKQSGQGGGTQAQTAQPTYTVTLTAAQLAQLVNGGKAATAGGAQHVRQPQRRVHAAGHHTRSDNVGSNARASSSGSRGTHHSEAAHHGSSSGSAAGSHYAGTSHHSGDCGDGAGDCGD